MTRTDENEEDIGEVDTDGVGIDEEVVATA